MGKCFSDEVELALKYIYYDLRAGKGEEGLTLLKAASDAGDGDASCILARCYCGSQYVWSGHDFPEDDDKAVALLRKSIDQGSAVGVLVAMRTGELTQDMERHMPFSSLEEVFDCVLKKAQTGDAFCQYTVGNTYFWWDFLRIQGKDRSSFSTQKEFKEYLRENISKCEDWFQKAFRGGMYFAANNLNRYYTQGDEDIILPRPEKAVDLWKTGAEMGYPIHQYIYADNLKKEGKMEDALYWYKLAVEGGQLECWYCIGEAYENGTGVPEDISYAVQCYEKGLTQRKDTSKKVACANALGALCYEGKKMPKDYDRAFRLLKYGLDHGSDFGVCYLGKCYFRGWGTQQDYGKARELLEKVTWTNKEAFYMLGAIYGQGLGVPADIKKGVGYLLKAGDNIEAKEELLKYKKTLFGKWVRR
ncbi:tetratricopeptide repeat protein [Lachnospiraceae bacterium 62-35]